MAKERKEPKSEELEELTSTENFIDKYKKPLIIAGVGIVVVVLGIIGYQKLIAEPHEEESQDAYWNAFYDFENDSLQTAVSGTADYAGMEEIAADYSGTSGGDIANYTLAIAAIDRGEFETAMEYLDECDFEDIIVGSLVIGLKGDCSVEMDDYEAAANYFEDAAAREENEYTTPMFLKKAGLAYEALNQPQKALTAYNKIKDNWPNSDDGEDIEKYIGRVE